MFTLLIPVHGPARVTPTAVGTAAGRRPWPVKWIDTVDGQPIMWCGDRRTATLPGNSAAFALAAGLGCADLADRIGLHGDLLIAGALPDGTPADVPEPILDAARRTGLLPADDAGPRAPGSAVPLAPTEQREQREPGESHPVSRR